MTKRLYVHDPKLIAPTGETTIFVCFNLMEWEQGVVAVPHPPCFENTRVELVWGDGLVEIKQKTIDLLIESFPGISSNDIIFLGGWN